MQTSRILNRLIQSAKRAAVGVAAAVTLSAIALSAQAANIYGPPALQANSASNAPNVSTAAVSADFNNDGYPDLAVVNENTSQLLIYLGTPIGGLALTRDFNNLVFGLQVPRSISAGDIDGDGKIDLVITDSLGVSVLKGSGNNNADFNTFGIQRPLLADADTGAFNASLADLNQDGKLDIVVGVHEYGNFGGTDYFEVLQNVGFGNFILIGQYEVSSSGYAARSSIRTSHLADIDGDGKADLVFRGSYIGTNISWLKGLGNGGFLPQADLLGVGAGATDIEDIEVADIDGDGKVDILMQNSYGQGVWIAKGVGNGVFLPTTKLYATGVSGNNRDMGRIIIADVNGDGRLDVISDGYVGLQQANHSFVLNEHIGYSVTRMLAAIDVNRDGRADLVTSGPGTGKIAVFKTIALSPASVGNTGSPQSTVFNTSFAQPLSIKVLDGNGVGVPGLAVSITPVNPGPSLPVASTGSGTTNAQGVFSYTPVANGVMGCYEMKGTIGVMGNTPIFSLCNTNTNSLAVTMGDNQTTLVSTPFGTPLQVRLTDEANNPKAGVTVTFGGPNVPSRVVLSSTTAVTNAQGFAAVNATATGKSGAYSVSVTAPSTTGTSIKLSNTAPAGAAAAVAFGVGTPQYAYVTQPFSDFITAHVTDFPGGNPVQGATVVFAIAPDAISGAAATLSALTAVTDANGDAKVSATANGFVGSYTVKLSVPASSLVSPQSRVLRNIADLPKFMESVSGTPQSTPVNTSFSQKLRVKVSGWDNSATPQVPVYFLVDSGATLSAVSVLADAGGFAEVTATADASVGSYQVTAIVYDTVLEQPITQTFDLTNTAGLIPPGGSGGPVAVPVNHPLALFGLMLAVLGFARRRVPR